jgi:hypothetical protein
MTPLGRRTPIGAAEPPRPRPSRHPPFGANANANTGANAAEPPAGPWEQGPPLVEGGGHGMPFRASDGTRLMVLHKPFGSPTTRAKIYEQHDAGDRFELGRRRTDLDGGD